MNKKKNLKKTKISILEESDDDQTHLLKPIDMMAQNDIRKRLVNYDIVEDVSNLLPGQQILYFEKLTNGCFRYKPGGFVAVNRSPDYLVLTNGRNNWSVQLSNHIILAHYDRDRLISNFQHQITQYKEKIEQFRHLIKNKNNTIKKLMDKING